MIKNKAAPFNLHEEYRETAKRSIEVFLIKLYLSILIFLDNFKTNYLAVHYQSLKKNIVKILQAY
jgi:hypothetical protein